MGAAREREVGKINTASIIFGAAGITGPPFSFYETRQQEKQIWEDEFDIPQRGVHSGRKYA